MQADFLLRLPSLIVRELDVSTPSEWPTRGDIAFSNFSLRYRTGLQNVLKNLNLHLHLLGACKVGVVGRTGSGKSTIAMALFRVVEASEGSISIDGIGIATRGLSTLRSRLGIVPQVPTLFEGSLRSNLDPRGVHSDEVLDAVQASDKGFDQHVAHRCANWSVDQKQLICLARTMPRKFSSSLSLFSGLDPRHLWSLKRGVLSVLEHLLNLLGTRQRQPPRWGFRGKYASDCLPWKVCKVTVEAPRYLTTQMLSR